MDSSYTTTDLELTQFVLLSNQIPFSSLFSYYQFPTLLPLSWILVLQWRCKRKELRFCLGVFRGNFEETDVEFTYGHFL